MSFIQAQDLTKTYGQAQAAATALSGVSLDIQAGEYLAVMGESGSGKSTLLSILGGLNRPTSGRLTVAGSTIYDLTQDQLADFRQSRIGFVFQSFHLIPFLDLAENVMLPLATSRLPRRRKRDLALAALARVGLQGKENRKPGEISGGEQERVAIARAVVNSPALLLADEPTGNLDSKTSAVVLDLLAELGAAGTTLIVVTHSQQVAERANRTITLADGRVCAGAA